MPDLSPAPADTLDPAGDEPETGPLRRCIITRERLPKEQMIRFVIGPDRQLVPDLAGKLPGRGMWLRASADVLEGADAGHESRLHKEKPGSGLADRRLARAFSRAARGLVVVPADLASLLQAALIRRITELLGLARRAGQTVAGFEKGREYLRTTPARLVLQASDGSTAERARFLSGSDAAVKVFDPLPGATLGRVFGRDYVVHVVVAPGKLADAVAMEAGRLAGLRSSPERARAPEKVRPEKVGPAMGMVASDGPPGPAEHRLDDMGSARTTGREAAPVNTVLGANG